jgi:hypothetical protein
VLSFLSPLNFVGSPLPYHRYRAPTDQTNAVYTYAVATQYATAAGQSLSSQWQHPPPNQFMYYWMAHGVFLSAGLSLLWFLSQLCVCILLLLFSYLFLLCVFCLLVPNLFLSPPLAFFLSLSLSLSVSPWSSRPSDYCGANGVPEPVTGKCICNPGLFLSAYPSSFAPSRFLFTTRVSFAAS